APAFGHFGLGRAGDLVIDDFLGLAGLLARSLVAFRAPLAAGKLVADADLAFLPVAAGRRFLPRLARTHDAAFGIESLGGLRHAVEVEIGGELDPRPPRSDHRSHDRLHLLAQTPLVSELALRGRDSERVLAARGRAP